MLNKVILIGNVGQEPDVRFTNQEKPIVNLSLATTESFKDKSGERKTITQWHKVVIFNENLCRIAQEYVKKGSKIYVEGSIQNRKYTGSDGVEKNITEIVLTQFKGELILLDKLQKNEFEPSELKQQEQPKHSLSELQAELNDEVPF